jgi:hypothetical protein
VKTFFWGVLPLKIGVNEIVKLRFFGNIFGFSFDIGDKNGKNDRLI